jgi:hypothetical protein
VPFPQEKIDEISGYYDLLCFTKPIPPVSKASSYSVTSAPRPFGRSPRSRA